MPCQYCNKNAKSVRFILGFIRFKKEDLKDFRNVDIAYHNIIAIVMLRRCLISNHWIYWFPELCRIT